VPHVRLGQLADLVVVAPATADLLAHAAHGLAGDLLTNVLLTARCPVLLAPAMHTEMWLHAATQANVALLRERGVHVLDPAAGRLTGTDTGPGRLPEPAELHAACLALLAQATDGGAPNLQEPHDPLDRSARDLTGRRVVVSAGGTREPLDPVRYLGNRSSGKQGHALAEVALARGAEVVLVTTSDLPVPDGVQVVPVETAQQLRAAVVEAAASADAVVMAAAVADFRPVTVATHKIKKSDDGGAPTIELVRNPDVLAELSAHRASAHQVVVGFAAETGDADGDVLTHGRAKLARKGCDLLVVNEVGGGLAFGSDVNQAVVLDREGGETLVPTGPKSVLAAVVWDAVAARLARADR
jgi:phosphopantothenoylcysteine decarboxylase/phosphopantothenate--cysteine ligase